MAGDADLIFAGGRVHTVNASNDIAEGVAVRAGRITKVGSNAEVRAEAGPGTRVVDLQGRTLVPGFHDAHAHFPWLGATLSQINCKAPGMQSICALQEAVRAQ